MSNVTFTNEQMNAILNILETQRFADFYTGPFEDFITGDAEYKLNITHQESRALIKEQIRKLF